MKKQRWLSLVLILALVVGLCSVCAAAADDQTAEQPAQEAADTVAEAEAAPADGTQPDAAAAEANTETAERPEQDAAAETDAAAEEAPADGTHIHAVNREDACEEPAFEPLTVRGGQLESGCYYLTEDWTLDEQKAVAEDIAAKGEASPAYAKAKAAMDAGTKFSVQLTNGKTLEYRIIGINHDDLADGSGKAGLTFLTTSTGIQSRMNARNTNVANTNAGGWEKSELRAKMNSGEIWNLMPSDFQSKVKSVRKLTNNVGGTDKNAAVTATTDKLFLLSYSEIVPTSYWASYPWTSSEGSQYEAFKGKVTENYDSNSAIAIGNSWWERSACPNSSGSFLYVNSNGDPSDYNLAADSICVCPAFSF